MKLVPEQAAWGGLAGQTGGFLVGVDWGKHLGAEIAGDSVNHIIAVNGFGEVSEYGQGWVMANLRIRFPHGRLSPYVYIGPGICYAEIKEDKPPANGFSLSGSQWHPALNVGGGLEYFITRRFSLDAGARWAYSWGHSFNMGSLSTKGDISHVGATIGLRVYLWDL